MNRHNPRAALPAPGFLRTRIDRLAHRLLQHAARQAPPLLAERLEEEWLADMQTRRGTLARLRLAIGCRRAASVIAREHGTPKVAAATARGPATAAAYAPDDPTFFSRRSAAVLAILVLHAVLIYLLAMGIVHKDPAAPPPPLVTTFTDDVSHPTPPPPLPGPQFTRHTIDLPAPDHDWGSPAGADAITVPEQRNPAPVPTPAAVRAVRLAGGPGKGFPNTADFYPSPAIRLHQEGSVAVQVCVGGSGQLTSAPSIAQSSGSQLLDAGALALARAGSGHYRPTTEDGRPVSSCFPVRIRFELKN